MLYNPLSLDSKDAPQRYARTESTTKPNDKFGGIGIDGPLQFNRSTDSDSNYESRCNEESEQACS